MSDPRVIDRLHLKTASNVTYENNRPTRRVDYFDYVYKTSFIAGLMYGLFTLTTSLLISGGVALWNNTTDESTVALIIVGCLLFALSVFGVISAILITMARSDYVLEETTYIETSREPKAVRIRPITVNPNQGEPGTTSLRIGQYAPTREELERLRTLQEGDRVTRDLLRYTLRIASLESYTAVEQDGKTRFFHIMHEWANLGWIAIEGESPHQRYYATNTIGETAHE